MNLENRESSPGGFSEKPRPFTLSVLRWSVVLFLTVLAALLLVADDAEATHYRGGTLSWEPTENPNEALFTGRTAWRTSFPWGGACTVAAGNVCTGMGNIDMGDGSPVVPFAIRVTSVLNAHDAFAGEIVDPSGDPLTHTYATPNDVGNGGIPWQVSWQTCCRIGWFGGSPNEHMNNPDDDHRLETEVDLAGLPNASPKLSLPMEPGLPLFHICPESAICTIPVDAFDPGDPLAFRLATPAEVGSGGFLQPGQGPAPNLATIHPATGVITWDTTGAPMSGNGAPITVYSMAVVAEDGQTKTILDFLISFCSDQLASPECYDCGPGPANYYDPTTGGCVVCGPMAVGIDGGLVEVVYDPNGAPPDALYICEPPPPCGPQTLTVNGVAVEVDTCQSPCRVHGDANGIPFDSGDACDVVGGVISLACDPPVVGDVCSPVFGLVEQVCQVPGLGTLCASSNELVDEFACRHPVNDVVPPGKPPAWVPSEAAGVPTRCLLGR